LRERALDEDFGRFTREMLSKGNEKNGWVKKRPTIPNSVNLTGRSPGRKEGSSTHLQHGDV